MARQTFYTEIVESSKMGDFLNRVEEAYSDKDWSIYYTAEINSGFVTYVTIVVRDKFVPEPAEPFEMEVGHT